MAPIAMNGEEARLSERLLGYCGIDCAACLAFIGTKTGRRGRLADAALRASDTSHCYSPDDMLCDGCTILGGRTAACCRGCRVRECAAAAVVTNCADCADYPCILLAACWARHESPDAHSTLDRLRPAPAR